MAMTGAMMTPIGSTLLVAAALGKSVGTLLGPTTATKMVYNQASKDGGVCKTISSNPVTLLRAMDIEHPVGSLVLEALEGMELAFGTGVTSLATMCGAFSTACRVLQGEGVPRSSVLHGFRVAEDLCVDVVRGLSVRTAHVGQERQEYRGHGAACRQNTRDIIPRSPVSIPTLAHLAAGLQHCAGCNHAAATDQEERRHTDTDASGPPNLSLPAALALDALSAVLATNAPHQGSPGGHFVPDLKRVRTRLIVGPEAKRSCVVPVAAAVEVAPWERATVQDVFVQRRSSRDACQGEGGGLIDPLPHAIATIHIAAVAVVLGDVSVTAGASSAATSQTPVTQVLRGGEALLNRSAVGGSAEEAWVEEKLRVLDCLGVDALVTTGDVCAILRQAFEARGILLLSSVSQGEAEAAGLAANATPVPRLDLLTPGDVGRGHEPGHRLHEGSSEDYCGDGQQGTANGDCRLEIEEMQRRRRIRLSASLLEVGTVGDEQSTFVPKQGTRGDLEHSNADMVVLLHQRRGAADGDGGNRDRGAPLSRAWSRTDEEAGGRNADVVVMLCGPVSCTCEELRHRFWRVLTRVTGALSDGVVLPGAGACEVACAASLELEALVLEEDNARDFKHIMPQELYTPMVLRAVAAALDEVISTCMANAGHSGTIALHHLSAAKRNAKSHLSRKRPHRDLTVHPPVATSCRRLACCPEWGLGFCPGLAVVSFPETVTTSSAGYLTDCGGGEPLCTGLSRPRGSVRGGTGTRLRREGAAIVLDNYSAKVGCLRRAVALVGLLAGAHGMLLPPSLPQAEYKTAIRGEKKQQELL